MSRLSALLLLVAVSAPAAAGTMVYYGGPVVPNARVYVVFWGPASRHNPVLTAAQGGMADYFTGILNSSYVDGLNQYDTAIAAQAGAHSGAAGTGQHIGRGNYAGTFELATTVLTGVVPDDQIQSALLDAIARGDLPPSDANTVYGIFFPSTISVTVDGGRSCSRNGFGGYHNATTRDSAEENGVAYMVLPDCGTNWKQWGQLVSHETGETITDRAPTPGSNPNYPQAWNDTGGNEVGDVCEGFPAATVTTAVGDFPVQVIWDETTNSCQAAMGFPQDYSVAVDPPVAELRPGQTVSVAVHTGLSAGSSQALALSVSAPAGVSASIDKTSVAAGDSATLTISAAETAVVPRDAQVVVSAKGSNGAAAQTHTAALLIQPPEFTLFVSAASGAIAGSGTATFDVTLTRLHGDAGPIQLAALGLPASVQASFAPATIAGAGTSKLTLTAHGAAQVKDAQFVVAAQGGAARHTAGGTFTIEPGHGCSSAPAECGILALLAWMAMLARRRRVAVDARAR